MLCEHVNFVLIRERFEEITGRHRSSPLRSPLHTLHFNLFCGCQHLQPLETIQRAVAELVRSFLEMYVALWPLLNSDWYNIQNIHHPKYHLHEHHHALSTMHSKMQTIELQLRKTRMEFDLWKENTQPQSNQTTNTTDYIYDVLEKLSTEIKEMKKKVAVVS
ncbi:hypothetical protein NECAME_08426 [Necator americanus]|uniref:Uncharacterized protein n=1 Tax=Necator americanus TaxID=51031 RepID=W2THM3_NECAM|nr:hypothetical protein NECAME_08426 [Necator americanus]ETN81570.1 hypothetical protein NECAME_08426 [Necator americanus]